jgi:copper chaperone CopZ
MALGLEHSMISWPRAFPVLVLSIMLLPAVSLIAQDKPAPTSKQAVVAVKGMACSACGHRLQKVLSKLGGVEKVEVRFEKEQAILVFAPDARVTDNQIKETVRNAGFVPGKIEWSTVKLGKEKDRRSG